MVTKKLPWDLLRDWVKAKTTVKDAGKSDLDTMQEFIIHKRDKQQSHGHLMDMDKDLNANEADGS